MGYGLSFILDGLILVFLGVSIFYAVRLTMFFKTFRDGRDGLQLLIRELSTAVDTAENAIGNMKKNAVESDKDLRQLVSEAKFLSDELRFMNEAGDGLAKRLDKLADRNRELLTLLDDAGGIGVSDETVAPKSKKAVTKRPVKKTQRPAPSKADDFSFDDVDLDADDEADFQAFSNMDDIESSSLKDLAGKKETPFNIVDKDMSEQVGQSASNDTKEEYFYSRAEQELYEALQRKKQIKERS